MTPIQQRAERLRAIALEAVLQQIGAQADPHDPRKWHTAQGVLSVTGSKFINWKVGSGGGGAIDLVLHLRQRGFLDALDWLQAHFPGGGPLSSVPPPRRPLKLPLPAPANRQHIQAYLTIQRGLPRALINRFIDSALIYADAKANAVFVLLGKENQPVGAELRGTLARWRGMAPGSRKDRGCFGVGSAASSGIILCESAIDALSCSALHPRARCLSTAGARPNASWLPELIQQRLAVYCGYDADPVGDAMAGALQARYPVIKRLRPSRKDWNDVLRSR